MKNFEESLRRLNAPELPVTPFKRELRRDLTAAAADLSRRRWRGACLAACGLSVVLAFALTASVAIPALQETTLRADHEISVDNDREFIEAYYAREGSGVQVKSVDAERLVAVREFTLSDGRRMLVYTESDENGDSRSVGGLDENLSMLASLTATTF